MHPHPSVQCLCYPLCLTCDPLERKILQMQQQAMLAENSQVGRSVGGKLSDTEGDISRTFEVHSLETNITTKQIILNYRNYNIRE